jgi:ferredoxin
MRRPMSSFDPKATNPDCGTRIHLAICRLSSEVTMLPHVVDLSAGPELVMQSVNDILFETALSEHVEAMLDACTRCGKCVEVCPSVEPAGISGSKSEDVIGGILELVRTGNGPEASRKWAQSCMQSGECIKACDYGVNPRFLLTMARLGIAKSDNVHEEADAGHHVGVYHPRPLWL